MTTTAKLSPYEVRHYATSLSAFTAEDGDRQIALHVERGDFGTDDAQRIVDVTAFYRRFGQ